MSAEPQHVACVVLAAGEASRMGEPKVILPYRGSTIIETVVSTATEADLVPVVVVTGFHHEAVTAVIGDSATVVYNPDAVSGNLSSLSVGMSVLGEVDAVVILLGDMPGVEPQTVQQLAHQVISTGAAGGWVRYRGDQGHGDEMGHPMVLSRQGIDGFASLTGTRPLWRYLNSLDPDDVVVLDVDADKPIDVNTPDDYRRLLADQP